MNDEDKAQQQAGLATDSPNPSSLDGAGASTPSETSQDAPVQAYDNQDVKGSNPALIAAAEAKAPEADRLTPPVLESAAGDSDFEFVLKLFGVDPASYVLHPEGTSGQAVLDRSLLAHQVEAYRHLFANRVTHGRFVG